MGKNQTDSVKKRFIFENLFVLCVAIITFVGILATAIIFKQHPLRAAPLFISLIVMLLQARVSRFAFLLGGINSVLYAVSNVTLTLYASAAQAVLLSLPLQIITFFTWHRKTKDGVTELRRMSLKARIICIVAFVAVWAGMYAVFSLMDSPYLVFDITCALIGTVVSILSLLRFCEYVPLQLLNTAISLATHFIVFLDSPSNITYVIYYLYTAVCMIASMLRMKSVNMVK